MSKHISAKRVASSVEQKLWKNIKRQLKKVKELSNGRHVVGLFKHCYPNLWLDVCNYHKNMVRWNSSREKKSLKTVYDYKSPDLYLKSKLSFIGNTQYIGDKTPEEIDKIITSIRNDSLDKLRRRKSKEARRERLIQHTTPSYVTQHTEAYFNTRMHYPKDIDARYLIVHELAKYKCDDTIRFLCFLVRCEKNIPLRDYAWDKLNELGITGVHKGRRIGKKELNHKKNYTPIKNPSDLLKAIYNSPLEQMKQYDLFLSHSYKDKNKLIELKDLLNGLGVNVYMDWVNDKDELQRDLTCAETAKVITERIKTSKAILYVHTDSSLYSKWTPWELGYAYALQKPIFIYRPEKIEDEPEYLLLYHSVDIENGDMKIRDCGGISIKEWLEKQ